MKIPTVMLVEDNAADVLIIQRALRETGVSVDLVVMRDGQEAMDYLLRQNGSHPDPGEHRPVLILLDLNLPRLTGRQVVERIRSTASLRGIPIIVLTTSSRKEDVARLYAAGASSYLTKPNSFQELVQVLDILLRYWLETVQLPGYEMS